MSNSRRNFLKLVGGGIVVAAAGAGTFAVTRTPHKALAPWQQAGNYDDPRKRALSYALLAPNPHNRQPWLVDLSQGDDHILIYRDLDKRLPETDPFDRQLTIGMGCFLELLVMAAAEEGIACDLELFPEPAGETRELVAKATFSKGATADPLFAHVHDRRSCKEPFEARPVPADAARELESHASGIVTDPAEVDRIKKLTWDAWLVEMNTPHTLQESIDLMRFGKSEINANPDGIDLGGPFLESLMLAGLLDREQQADPASMSFKEGIKIYSEMLHATPAYAFINTAGNTRADQIDAGRRWVRLNLTTTALGLSLHPVSQALQEYQEMAAHHRIAHMLLAPQGETVQMLGRLGYGPSTGPSPRWPLEKSIVN